ncbi:hypothetical protein ACFWDA_24445 [Rhodococcus zopfii]|uniref:hypothetical protein n=1 Tax=Rhodococcus zopfii TaxID=43772 RepID=UPI00365DBB97
MNGCAHTAQEYTDEIREGELGGTQLVLAEWTCLFCGATKVELHEFLSGGEVIP